MLASQEDWGSSFFVFGQRHRCSFLNSSLSLLFLDSVLYCLIIHEVPVLAMPLSYIPFTSESKILSYLKLKTKIPKSLMVLL